jgi:hypothetical protein
MASGQNISNLNISVGLDSSQAQKGLNDLITKVEGFAASLSNVMAASGFAAGIAGVATLAGKLDGFTTSLNTFATNIKATFGAVNNQFDTMMKGWVAGLSGDQLAKSITDLGKLGYNLQNATDTTLGLASLDKNFGGAGKAAEKFHEVLKSLNGTMESTHDALAALDAGGVKVFDKLGQRLGVNADQARKLSENGQVNSRDAQMALRLAGNDIRDKIKAGGNPDKGWVEWLKGMVWLSDREAAALGGDGFQDVKLNDEELAALQAKVNQLVHDSVAHTRAGELATKLKSITEIKEDALNKMLKELDDEIAFIEKSSNLTGEDKKNLDIIKKARGAKQGELADLVNADWMKQTEEIIAKEQMIEGLLNEGLSEYEQFALKTKELLKKFDDVAVTLDGEARMAVLKAKDRALAQRNEQADNQFMDANQKLANDMNAAKENLEKAKAAGDNAGAARFRAQLARMGQQVADLGTFAQGSNIANVNRYGSQEWAQARSRAMDTDQRSFTEKYLEGLDKLNSINAETRDNTKKTADAVEKFAMPNKAAFF